MRSRQVARGRAYVVLGSLGSRNGRGGQHKQDSSTQPNLAGQGIQTAMQARLHSNAPGDPAVLPTHQMQQHRLLIAITVQDRVLAARGGVEWVPEGRQGQAYREGEKARARAFPSMGSGRHECCTICTMPAWAR